MFFFFKGLRGENLSCKLYLKQGEYFFLSIFRFGQSIHLFNSQINIFLRRVSQFDKKLYSKVKFPSVNFEELKTSLIVYAIHCMLACH